MITSRVDLTSPEAYLGRAVSSRDRPGRHRVTAALRLRHGVFLGTACGHYVRLDSVVPKGDTEPCTVCALLHTAAVAG